MNHARLDTLKAARADARATASQGIGQYADKRRHAQIQARHALQTIAAGLKARQLTPAAQAQAMASAVHAAELQLPGGVAPICVLAMTRLLFENDRSPGRGGGFAGADADEPRQGRSAASINDDTGGARLLRRQREDPSGGAAA